MSDGNRYPAGGSEAFEYSIGDDETVVEAVLRAVEAVTDRRLFPRPDEPFPDDEAHELLPPLHEAVDPDALRVLSSKSCSDSSLRITFHYAGCTVTVEPTDTVRVSERATVGSGD